MAIPAASVWTAFGFVVGAIAGGALATALAGRPVAQGRRCAGCGASLSPLARFPILSWLAILPRCRRCGLATSRLLAVFEAGFVLIGLAAILATPFPSALLVALGGWAALFLAAFLWRRYR